MYLVLLSVFRSLVWLLLRLPLNKQGVCLTFDIPIEFKEAEAFRKANGMYVRKNQWRDTTVKVCIDLD